MLSRAAGSASGVGGEDDDAGAVGVGVGVGPAVGTCIPALMWMACSFAAACSPNTKGDSDSGLAMERDSWGEEAM